MRWLQSKPPCQFAWAAGKEEKLQLFVGDLVSIAAVLWPAPVDPKAHPAELGPAIGFVNPSRSTASLAMENPREVILDTSV